MVRGLERFQEHFRAYANSYVLIGGTACSLVMDEAGLEFRATKDLDIVLCIEALDAEFVQHFWDFIDSGGYEHRQKSTGKNLFYRFDNPGDDHYPAMLELFSRAPDALKGQEGHLTPIPLEEEMISLSAILLDEDYYRFIHAGKRTLDGLSVVAPEHLIPLKARAWLDLTQRKIDGETVDEKHLRKHKLDVFRLFQLLDPESIIDVPANIRADVKRFIEQMESAPPIDLKSLAIKGFTLDEFFEAMRRIYGHDQ